MSNRLRLDWCSHRAAVYAVTHWHYSRTMPVGKLAKVGVWEDDQFIGVVLFGLGGGGACDGRRYGLARNFQIAELQRVALTTHATPVSRIIAIALRLLAKHCPDLRMVVSYADPAHNHHGGIYQAGGWIYEGESSPVPMFVLPDGRMLHHRIAANAGRNKQFGDMTPVDVRHATRVELPAKHRYLYPLTADLRARLIPMAKAYPKRAKGQASEFPSDLDGSTPIRTLQPIEGNVA